MPWLTHFPPPSTPLLTEIALLWVYKPIEVVAGLIGVRLSQQVGAAVCVHVIGRKGRRQ